MGKNFKLTSPRYTDFVYQPNYDLELAKVEKQAEVKALEGQMLNFMNEYTMPENIWEGAHTDLASEKLSGLKSEADVAGQEWQNNKSDANLKKFKDSMGAISDEFVSGDIGKMMYQYNVPVSEYQRQKELNKKEKDANTKVNREQRTNAYLAMIQDDVKDNYDPDYPLPTYVDYMNIQKDFKEYFGEFENLKVKMKQPGYLDDTYVTQDANGKVVHTPIPVGGKWVKDAKTGTVTDMSDENNPQTYDMVRKYAMMGTNLAGKYRDMETTVEGYKTDDIRNVLYGYANSNAAFRAMVTNDYSDYNRRGYKWDEVSQDYIKDENQDIDDYIEERIMMEVDTYSNQFPEITSYEVDSKLVDDKQWEEDYKLGVWKKKQQYKKDEESKPDYEITNVLNTSLFGTGEEGVLEIEEFSKEYARLNSIPKLDPTSAEGKKLTQMKELVGDIAKTSPETILNAVGESPGDDLTPEEMTALAVKTFDAVMQAGQFDNEQYGDTYTAQLPQVTEDVLSGTLPEEFVQQRGYKFKNKKGDVRYGIFNDEGDDDGDNTVTFNGVGRMKISDVEKDWEVVSPAYILNKGEIERYQEAGETISEDTEVLTKLFAGGTVMTTKGIPVNGTDIGEAAGDFTQNMMDGATTVTYYPGGETEYKWDGSAKDEVIPKVDLRVINSLLNKDDENMDFNALVDAGYMKISVISREGQSTSIQYQITDEGLSALGGDYEDVKSEETKTIATFNEPMTNFAKYLNDKFPENSGAAYLYLKSRNKNSNKIEERVNLAEKTLISGSNKEVDITGMSGYTNGEKVTIERTKGKSGFTLYKKEVKGGKEVKTVYVVPGQGGKNVKFQNVSMNLIKNLFILQGNFNAIPVDNLKNL